MSVYGGDLQGQECRSWKPIMGHAHHMQLRDASLEEVLKHHAGTEVTCYRSNNFLYTVAIPVTHPDTKWLYSLYAVARAADYNYLAS